VVSPGPTCCHAVRSDVWPAGYGVREVAGVLAEEARSSEDGLLLLRPAFLSQVYRGGLEPYVDDDLISMGLID